MCVVKIFDMNLKIILLSLLILSFEQTTAQIDSLVLKNELLELSSIKALRMPDDTNYSQKQNGDVIRIADAFAYTLTSPIRWEGEDWRHIGMTIGGTLLLSLADEPMYDIMKNNKSKTANYLAEFGYHNGKPYAAYGIAGGFYAVGWLIDDQWTRETAVVLTTAYATSGVLQAVFKKVVGRARPTEGFGNYEFRPFRNDAGFSSFPSGHTQIAFVTAMVLAERVDQTWLKAVFYTGAAVTMASRMYVNAHWLTDVTLGAVLGYFCTNTVIRRLEQNRYGKPFTDFGNNKIRWQLTPSLNGIGVIGTF